MEKLDKVIAGLSECSRGRERDCENCLYWEYVDYTCVQMLRRDALEVIEALRAERDDLRKDVEVLTEENERLRKSLKIARLQRKQAWDKLARITGEREAAWLEQEVTE